MIDKAEKYLPEVRNASEENIQFEYLRQNLPGMALELAKSNLATERVLDILTRHPLITVRHEVAKNIRCSVSTLERLSSDKDMLVRDYARRTLKKKNS
jgi:hypothetical protein